MVDANVHRRTQTVCLVVLAVVAAGVALQALASVLVPFVLAILLAIALRPLVRRFEQRLRLPQAVAVGLVLALAAALVFGVVLLIAAGLDEFSQNLPRYEERATQLAAHVRDVLVQWGLMPDPETAPADASGERSAASAPVADRIRTEVFGWVRTAISSAGTIVSQSAMVLVFLGFLLFGVGPRGSTLVEAGDRIRSFLVLKSVMSLLTGLGVWVVLALFEVDLAMVFGLLAVLLNFVPSIGSILATLLPIPIILLADHLGPGGKAAAIAIPGVVQFLVGNVVEPKVMGQSLGLHPITQLLALLVWGVLWGPIGILLAVPLTAAIQVALEHTEGAESVANLLAGRLPGEGDRPGDVLAKS